MTMEKERRKYKVNNTMVFFHRLELGRGMSSFSFSFFFFSFFFFCAKEIEDVLCGYSNNVD